jgi:hypothetical protein
MDSKKTSDTEDSSVFMMCELFFFTILYFYLQKVESEFIPPVGLAPEPTNPNMDGVQALTIDRGDDNDAKKRRAKRPENTYLVCACSLLMV